MTEPVVVAPEAPAAAPNAAIPTPSGETVTPDGGSTPQTEAKPDRTFTQAELDEILEKRLAKERNKRKERERENEVLRRLALERGERPEAPKPAQPQSDGRPKREEFQDYEQYVEALADWKAETKIREAETRRQAQTREEQIRQYQAHVQREYQGRVEKARAKYEDFDDLVGDPTLPITVPMAHVIAEMEMGPDVAYYLAQNRADAERIARLSPARAAIELGKIEAKVASAPAPKTVTPSHAPAPITPVSGKAPVASDKPSDKDSVDTWLAKRNRQVYGART